MGKWQFEEVPATLVEQDPTQRDQFNNDEVGLAEALVREVIQNSTDAASGSAPVKVSFSVHRLDANASADLRGRFDSLRPHLQVCGVRLEPLSSEAAKILLIEDFGTKGLTGETGKLDNDNFRNFWRRHGRSGKGGASGGRWGLGKLVYSSCSELRSFFGMTARAGDTAPLLMGQAVLLNHEISGSRHPAHGFWFEHRGAGGIQLPVSDALEIDAFRKLTSVKRQLEPGLSIVIPYVKSNITEATLIEAVLRNYYFPILAGKLTVEVGAILIDQKNFHKVAAENEKSHQGQSIALSFVEAVSKQLAGVPATTASTSLEVGGVSEKMFQAIQLEAMKAAYRDGKLVQVRVPVRLKPRNAADVSSYIDLFLQAVPEGQKPFALFARGSITVPGEVRYFSGIHAYGAMVAADKGVAEFLGDAENPAHTNWIASAEKLADRWHSTGVVKQIRYSLRELHALIAEQVAREDQNALIDLFSLVDASRASTGPRKRTNKPVVNVVPREKAIAIKPCLGGFEIIAGPGAAKWDFPKRIKIRVAYDTMVGNPFTAHSKYDFDLTKSDIAINAKGATWVAQGPCSLVASVTGPDFVISGLGFDANRDIVVDARAA